MRRLSCIIILHLLFSACSSFNGFLATARIFHDHQPNSPHSPVNKILGGDIKRSRVNVLDNMERDIGKCGLYILVKTVGGDFELRAAHLRERSPETLTTKPFCLRNRSWSCLSYHGLLYFYFSKHHACGSSVELLLKQSNVLRRSLADKSPKAPASTAASPSAASPSSESTDDDSIIIPPELLFQPPPPPTTSDQSSTTGASQERQNNDLNKIITIVASVTGIFVIFSLALFCCVMRRRRGFQNKQRDDKPLLTLSSSDFSAGSSRNSDNKEFGREASFDGSSAQPEPRRVTPLADIPENISVNGANAEGSTLQIHANGDSTPLPAAAPPPPPKPKAPPPPPKGVRPPPAPPIAGGKGPHQRGRSTSGDGNEITGDPDGPRTKLKPFFWDKVVGSPDHSMVWDEIRAGSFQFNEERIESLFGYHPDDKRNNDRRGRPSDASQAQYVQIIDAKKSQNLSILLKALNVTTEEVRDALVEGNELPPEFLQTLLRMAPTQEEELKLRLFAGDLSQLGPAERFLKVMVDIPFAFKRMESLMFMMTFKEEVSSMKESFVTLEVACDELKKSRLFLKLLEAVLKTGNRMNDGTYRGGAQAFKLDTLLKLADVKGTDGKTTLLHFVVQEIIRAEGLKAVRAAKENCSISSMKSDDFVDDPNFDSAEQYRILGLQVVSSISSELENVKKAAVIDADGLTTTVSKLGQSLAKIKNLMKNEMDSYEEESGFYLALASFLEHSEDEVTWLTEEEQRISNLVRKTADYFHGNAGREEGLRLFSIVRDFLIMLDKICAQLKQSLSKPTKNTGKDTSPKRPSQDPQQSIQDMRERLFPAIAERRMVDSSSDSDSD